MAILGIFGAGGMGRDMLELAKQINKMKNRWKDYIFVNNGDESEPIDGVEVYSIEKATEKYGDELEAIVAVGEPGLRKKIYSDLLDKNIKGANLIHPDVHIPSNASIGHGVAILSGAYIGNNSKIGNNICISTNAVVGHDTILEDGVIVSANTIVNGICIVGDYSYIGPGAVVKENVHIGNYAIVVMNSAVFKDVDNEVMVMGYPARIVRKNENHEVFK